MSRPFSYHDKDMDVIGNMLFIHSYIPYQTYPGVPMCTIPPEVLKRIMETRNVAFVTSETEHPVTSVTILNDALFSVNDWYNNDNEYRWIYCAYPLKDI